MDEDLKNEYEKTIREQKQMAQKENEIRKREQEKVAHRENEKDKEIKQRNQEQRKQEEKQHRPQTVKENKPTRKNDKNFKQHLKVQIQQDTSKIKQQSEERQQKHIYTEVMEYLLEKRKTIYVKMQSKDLKTQREGISQWDKLEYLIEKTKELKENEGYMENLYGRVTKLKEKEESQLRREI